MSPFRNDIPHDDEDPDFPPGTFTEMRESHRASVAKDENADNSVATHTRGTEEDIRALLLFKIF